MFVVDAALVVFVGVVFTVVMTVVFAGGALAFTLDTVRAACVGTETGV